MKNLYQILMLSGAIGILSGIAAFKGNLESKVEKEAEQPYAQKSAAESPKTPAKTEPDRKVESWLEQYDAGRHDISSQKLYDASVARYNDEIAKDPTNPTNAMNAAICQYHFAKAQNQSDDLEKRAVAKGTFIKAINYAAKSIQLADSSKDAEEAKRIKRDAFYIWAVALFEMGRYEDAESSLDKSLNYGDTESAKKLREEIEKKLGDRY